MGTIDFTFGGSGALNPFWWQLGEGHSEEDAWKSILAYVRGIEGSQTYQHDLNIRNARLYTNADMLGLDWTLTEKNPTRKRISRVVENVIQSVVDTATSMIGKNRPRASFQTDGADWSLQRRAMNLEKFVEGQFSLLDVYKEGVKVFRDAVVFGTGAMKIYSYKNEIKCERVLIDEILVDEREARSEFPRQAHHRKMVNREVLKAMFPEKAQQIELANAGSAEKNYLNAWKTADPENIWVVESWHLPSGPDADDGRRTIAVEGVTLLWEDYDKDHFPFVFYRWSEPLAGFYGQGLAEQLTGIQLRVNKLNNFIQRSQDLIAVPRVFVDVATKQLKLQLNNQIGAIIPYRGKPPVFMTPQAVGAEIYNYKEQLKRSAYELAGISQLSATALKPAGLESAVALREYNDIETQRFAIQAQQYEEMFLEVAYRFVGLAREMHAEQGYEMQSVWRSNNYIKRIKWSEVDLDETIYVMTIEASSIMSRTPAGRMQQVIEMAQAGLLERDEARALLQHPDLKSSMDLLNSQIRNIERTIERLYDGESVAPEAFQNLAMGQKYVQMALLKASDDGAPEDILEGMRVWIGTAKSMLDTANQEMQMQQQQLAMAMGPGGPGGPGGAQPTPGLAQQAMNIRPSARVA